MKRKPSRTRVGEAVPGVKYTVAEVWPFRGTACSSRFGPARAIGGRDEALLGTAQPVHGQGAHCADREGAPLRAHRGELEPREALRTASSRRDRAEPEAPGPG